VPTDSQRRHAAVRVGAHPEDWDGLATLAPFEAKLQPPRLRPGAVERPDLLARLRKAEGVVLVTAPAGYGKTSLLAQYAAAPGCAWLSVTPEDNDVTSFIAYLARALHSIDPLHPEERASLIALGADGATVLLPRLGRVLAARPTPFSLVLDDVHLLTERQSIRTVEVLVSHLPTAATLVLAGRTDPPIQRARLRTQQTTLEIGERDLALDAEEARELLRGAGVDLDRAAADRVIEQAEGWPAGVYMAGLAAASGGDTSAPERPLIDRYLDEQVFSGLAGSTVAFLTRSSVLDHLDAITCDALLGRSDSAAVLAGLADSHLFVVPNGTPGNGYRYHPLFAEALRHELRRREPAEELRLHERASRLFESTGQPGPAIQHARLAGETDRAADLTWTHAQPMLGMGRGTTVLQWLQWFDDRDFEEEPALCVTMAWCCVTGTDQPPINVWLDQARRHDPETILSDGTPLGAALAVLDAVACERGLGAMVQDALVALQRDPEIRAYTMVARYLAGSGLALLGRTTEASAHLEAAAASAGSTPAPSSLALAQLAIMAFDAGDRAEAARLAHHAVELNEHYGLGERPFQAVAFAAAALVAAHRGDADTARRHLNHARRLIAYGSRFSPWQPIQNLVILARTELALNEVRAARHLWREAAERLDGLPDPGDLTAQIDALAAQIAAEGSRADGLGAPLTTAELRVLCYLPTHLSYQGIAEDLYVSRNTIKSQAIAIYRKLHVTSRQDAVTRARELGLLDDAASAAT
jgi:LuxR family maltose regulon positive regulatory protein